MRVGPLGLEDSMEFGRSARQTDEQTAHDRALLLQTRTHQIELEKYVQTVALKKPLSEQVAGAWGENLLLDGEISAASLCIGDNLSLWREGKPTGVQLQVHRSVASSLLRSL